jgi:hypothetical protein
MERRAFLQYALTTAAVAYARLDTAFAAAPTLADLQSVDELRVQFNRDAGKTRLLLLLSPT